MNNITDEVANIVEQANNALDSCILAEVNARNKFTDLLADLEAAIESLADLHED